MHGGETIDATIVDTNDANVQYNLKPNETVQYTAEVLVWENPDEEANYEEVLKSDISLTWALRGSLKLNQINLSMAGNEYLDGGDTDESPDTPDNPDNPNNPNNPGDDENTFSISGKAWLDENKNGMRENNESGLGSINVQLVNAETGNIIENVNTDAEGNYKFSQLTPGNYIEMFLYNNSLYSITQYKKSGVDETQNSDAIQSKIDNNTIGKTDTLVLTDSNLENIDIGLIRNAEFDLNLNKSITKVIVQNAEGTKQIGYNNAKLAKIEINGKYLPNSTVIVEYTIEIKNEGDIQGYINEVVDYMPKDLQFNSEINKDWYIGTDGNIHNISLSNTPIQAGETKKLTLTLTKKMTADNTGTSTNIAEIAKVTNDLSVTDRDSTAGNRKDGEDDISKAELIISVKTGVVVTYISLIILLGLILTVGIIIYSKRKGGKENEIKVD